MKFVHFHQKLWGLAVICIALTNMSCSNSEEEPEIEYGPVEDNFVVDGLCYNLLSERDKLIEITYFKSNASDNEYYVSGALEIPETVKYKGREFTVFCVGDSAFMGCKHLTSVKIPNNNDIGIRSFYGCSALTTVEFPDGINSIGNSAFSGCSALTTVEFPDGINSIGDSAFSGCDALTAVEFPDGINSIGANAFSTCDALTTVEFVGPVGEIGSYAFYFCTALTTVKFSDGINSIGAYAFSNCNLLAEIYCNTQTPPYISYITFSEVTYNKCIVYVPMGCKLNYKHNYEWHYFKNIVEFNF